MKPLYLLTLILTIANCITTTSYYPEGIENKQNGKVEKNKSAKPKVNLSVNGNFYDDYPVGPAQLPIDPYRKFKIFDQAFIYDPTSPIFLNVKISYDHQGIWGVIAPIFLPWIDSASATYAIQYGNQSQSWKKKFEIVRRVYLPIPIVSPLFNLSSPQKAVSERTSYAEIEEQFVYSLREEIAKIAPLADPESDTPQTADLPKSFNDIVVLKNGEILEGVHTKVTPTTLEVTESNGKKTIYKKSQVLSVKRK